MTVEVPTVLWDSDSDLFELWVERWRRQIGDRVEFVAIKEAGSELLNEVATDRIDGAIHLLRPDGLAFSGADAVFSALAESGTLRHRALNVLQNRSQIFAAVTSSAYARIVANRDVATKLTRLAWGNPSMGGYSLARDLFLRLVGLVALLASWSLAVQVEGLYGAEGILPFTDYLGWVEQVAGGDWVAKLVRAPTLLWWLPPDTGLRWCAWSGVFFGALLTLGIAPRVTIPAIWLSYLSLMGVGRVFLSFQWDALLLETLVVAWFLAPWSLMMRPQPLQSGWVGHIAARFLLFKLMWLSGWVKFASGDDAWSSMSALDYHFWSQPLPTWTAYWIDQLPGPVLSAATAGMFVIELIVPFFIFAPRRLRHFAAALIVALQIGIMATGNYGFFNLLTIALVLVLFDDGAFRRLGSRIAGMGAGIGPSRMSPLRQALAVCAAIVLLGASSMGFFGRFHPGAVEWVPDKAQLALRTMRSFNGYGLFAVMTRDRREIFIELSADGESWERVKFRYKPQEVDRRPAFVGPHMPRLDWQMWFAGLGTCQQNVWLLFTARELARENPAVQALFREPPAVRSARYVRFPSYQYRFGEQDWWTREPAGDFCGMYELVGGEFRQLRPADR